MDQNRFAMLQGWVPLVLQEIKKEIKGELLPSDLAFYRQHFGTRPMNRLTVEEIFKVYEGELLKGNEELSEWVINRWVFKHGDVYSHFADYLARIHPELAEIRELTHEQGQELMQSAVAAFGPQTTYLFSVLNSVVFPESILSELRRRADEARQAEMLAQEKKPVVSVEELQLEHARQLERLREKYEQKIAGVQKKYSADVEALKKQIRALQKRLA